MMASLDWMIIAIYFIAVFFIAFRAGKAQTTDGGSADFFLAGRNTGWMVVGASIFASNIGSEHLIGLAGTGAASGVAVAQFEIIAGFALLLLGWFFVPFYLSSGVFTMPEFLEKRFSKGARTYLAVVSVVGYVLTKISVTIAAGGIVFETLLGVDFWTGALIVVVATGVYTVWGGLRAVLYTDALQMVILLFGAIVITVIGLDAVGGWSAMSEAAGDKAMSLWRPMSDPDFPWTGILFGAPILAVWYWCTDQYIVQRVLSANGIEGARRATIMAAALKQLPLFIFVIPGVIAAVLVDQGRMTLAQPDAALPTLIGELLPAGLRGLLVAGLLAALMSSLSSVFNSCSTIVTMDLYQPLRPEATESELVTVGRISTTALVGLGLLWIPFIKLVSGQLFQYLQEVQSYIAPPIAAVFLIGLLWRGATARGAAWTLGLGAMLGVVKLLLVINEANLSGPLLWVADINFLEFAFLLFVASGVILVLTSGKEIDPNTEALMISGREAAADYEEARKRDKFMSLAVLALITIIWVAFS